MARKADFQKISIGLAKQLAESTIGEERFQKSHSSQPQSQLVSQNGQKSWYPKKNFTFG